MSCRYCGKVFNRAFNLRRHEKEYCPLRDEEKMSQSDSDSQGMHFEDNVSTSSTDESESSMSIENEAETGEETDPWIPLIEEARERSNVDFDEMKESLVNSGLDEQTAENQAYSNILPKLQKELESIYMQRLMWINQLKKDPIHRKIMHTKKGFIENDDFDPQEAMEAAIDKRKFLINRLLKEYSFGEIANDEED